MVTIIFLFRSEQDQINKKSLVLDVIYNGLGFKTSINVEQRINSSLKYSMVEVEGSLFPLFNELSSKDILYEID